MRYFGSILAIVLALSAVGQAQITKTATFENYAPGTFFQPSFIDPASGITFRNSTNPPRPGGFTIDGDPYNKFLGNNYLTAGIGPSDAFGFYFGFTGDLPAAADRISLYSIYGADSTDHVILKGFDSSGTLVAQDAGPGGLASIPFMLTINSDQYDITSFQISVGSGWAAYDNISYTCLPEPTAAAILGIVPLLIGYRNRRNRFGR